MAKATYIDELHASCPVANGVLELKQKGIFIPREGPSPAAAMPAVNANWELVGHYDRPAIRSGGG